MRGTIPGLASPYSFGALMPAIYQEDEFAMRLLSVFDELLAPLVSSIDNGDQYLAPSLAPYDLLTWLASWVGIDELDETWPEESKRELIGHAIELYAIRGTVEGLKRHIAIYAGNEPVIEESGACSWSNEPDSDFPGSNMTQLVVKVALPTPFPVDPRRLELIVAASKPAHIPHRLEFIGSPGVSTPESAVTSNLPSQSAESSIEAVDP